SSSRTPSMTRSPLDRTSATRAVIVAVIAVARDVEPLPLKLESVSNGRILGNAHENGQGQGALTFAPPALPMVRSAVPVAETLSMMRMVTRSFARRAVVSSMSPDIHESDVDGGGDLRASSR